MCVAYLRTGKYYTLDESVKVIHVFTTFRSVTADAMLGLYKASKQTTCYIGLEVVEFSVCLIHGQHNSFAGTVSR